MGLMVVESMANPDAPRQFFFVPMRSRYFPWMFLAIFALFRQGVVVDLLVSMGFGYLCKPLNLHTTLRPNAARPRRSPRIAGLDDAISGETASP
jgi:hypothetical protein